jgi:hypothetical protein
MHFAHGTGLCAGAPAGLSHLRRLEHMARRKFAVQSSVDRRVDRILSVVNTLAQIVAVALAVAALRGC